jgi:hypothetical protein
MKMEERSLRTKPRGNNEKPNFQNIRLSFSSTAFVLIWSSLLPSNAWPKDRGSGVHDFQAMNSNCWQLDCQSGKAPDFQEKTHLGVTYV